MTLCSSHQFGALQSLVTSQQSVILEALKEVGKPCDNSKQARKQAIVLDCSTSDYFAFRLVLSSSLTKKNTERDRENRKRVRGKERKRDHQEQQETRSRERERARTASAEGEQTETEIINNNNRRKQDREIERANRKREGRRERNRDYQQQQETRRSDHLRSVQSLAIVAEIGAAAVHLG